MKYLLLIISCLFAACGPSPAVVQTLPDSTAVGFLRWYRDNEERLSHIRLVQGGYPDTTRAYTVDQTQLNRYLSELDRSGYLSPAYLAKMRRYVDSCGRYLNVHAEYDGPPSGFEGDLVMNTQDYMDVFNNLNNFTISDRRVDGEKARLKFYFSQYYLIGFALTRTNKRWLIDSLY
ncbi:MAG: hypothetical protein JO301_16310 [Chitinophagaceae bacterium]|nr:hypothetical protein [Chitinophagaceae bacterium]